MKIYRWILTLLVVAGVLWVGTPAALAWDDCPLGLVDDPYPGACPRYIDTNDDGICDHSQSDPTLSVANESVPIAPNDGVGLPQKPPSPIPAQWMLPLRCPRILRFPQKNLCRIWLPCPRSPTGN